MSRVFRHLILPWLGIILVIARSFGVQVDVDYVLVQLPPEVYEANTSVVDQARAEGHIAPLLKLAGTDFLAAPSARLKLNEKGKVNVTRDFYSPDVHKHGDDPANPGKQIVIPGDDIFGKKDIGLSIESVIQEDGEKLVYQGTCTITDFTGFSYAPNGAKGPQYGPCFRSIDSRIVYNFTPGQRHGFLLPGVWIKSEEGKPDQPVRQILFITLRKYQEPPTKFTMKFSFVDSSRQNAPIADANIRVEAPDVKQALVTDASGQVTINLPVERPRWLSVHASLAGYVPRLVTWNLDQPSLNLPTSYTLKTEKAQTIGGFVKNETGQAIEGAMVVLIIRGSNMGGMTEEVFNDIWEQRVVTDKDGKWRYESAPSDLRNLSVTIEHPDYINNDRSQERPKLEEFQKLTAILTARKGVPCAGTVTDSKGKPVADAEVVFGEAGEGSNSSPSVKTDAKGNFRFNAISIEERMQPPILTVYANGYAPEMVELPLVTMGKKIFKVTYTDGVRGYVPTTRDPVKELSALQIRLNTGKPIRLKFVNKKGQPLEGISLHPDYWKQHRPFNLCGFKSGKDGIVVWENAPNDEITYDIIGDRVQRKTVVLKPGLLSQTIQLRRNTVAAGKVTDAITGKEISSYTLIAGTYYPKQHPMWSGWARGAARKIESSTYTHLFDEPVHMQEYGGAGPGTDGSHRLRIEADGYEAAVSRPIANEEEDVAINFALKPAAAIRGVVNTADGKPVKDAQVIVAGPGNPTRIMSGVCNAGWDQLIVRTNDKGEYTLHAQEEDFPVAIAHPDVGYAVTTFAELKMHPSIHLLPWGQLQLIHANLSGSNIPYSVSNIKEFESEYQQRRITFEIGKPEKVNADTLLYKQLASGDVRIGQFGHSVDEGPVARIENNKTSTVDLSKTK